MGIRIYQKKALLSALKNRVSRTQEISWKLFDPFSFAGVNLKNRLVRSATYEKRADVDGFVTDSLIDLYKQLAQGGVGLIITGNALVHPSGRSVPQAICIHNDHYISRLKDLTDAVHKLGGSISIQLSHGGRQCFPSLLGGAQPMAPSAVYDPSTKINPRAMDDAEIWHLIDAFADAARRALYAGFDGVQIHAAHGYLVSEFLSPHTNRRNDYWGGEEERRFHFIEEIYEAMRKEAVGAFPIMVKMNADDFIEGGLTPAESLRIAKRLQTIGISAMEISGGNVRVAGKMTVRPNIEKQEQEGRVFSGKPRVFSRANSSSLL